MANIETSFQAAIDAGKIHGAVLCATDSRGNFAFNKAIGHRTLLSGEKKPLQLDDVLYLASASKLITTIAALQCVQDGLLTLEGDLSPIAPELASKQVLKGFKDDADETPILEPADGPITLEMLVTHSAGVAYDFLTPPLAKWKAKHAPADQEQGQRRTVEEAFLHPLHHQPGGGWMYGPGLDWAGRIVERVTGQTLGQHVRERILAPFGVDDAEFYPVTRDDLRARLVDLNPDDPDATGRAVLGGTGALNLRAKGAFGGHGLFMSATSYVKILQSLLANDGKLLSRQMVDTMFENHLTPASATALQAALEGPLGMFFRVGVDSETTKTGYGLSGLLTLEDAEGWYGSHTLSWGGGLTLAWFIDRKNDLCGIGAVQTTLPVDGDVVADLKQVFRKGVYHKRAEWEEDRPRT
ncbi:hypothetical protein UVI_02050720 [Ustilaginoidea virens]|uniref:Beta-lactamase-related domain-containing protein n=1 Tax=Ustilaginoidea virens TaxID=1159556 RepID=A0A1B5L2A9_USTVR|nr:hypothetical protein UVI_02050720 [Ustilaginoidea virens]